MHRVNPAEERTCRLIYETYDSSPDMTLAELVDFLNVKGLRTRSGKHWKKSQLHYMLTNPFYHGEFLFKGNLFAGTHAPYSTKNQFEKRLQRLSNNYAGKKKRDFEFSLAGHLRCDYGRRLTGQRRKGKYTYYTHTCTHRGKKEALREELVSRLVGRRNPRVSILAGLRGKYEVTFPACRRNSTTQHKFGARRNQQGDLIDALHDRPAAFLAAESIEQKVAILKGMSEEVTVSREIARIGWKQPFSFLLEPIFLDLKEQFRRSGENRTCVKAVQGWGAEARNRQFPQMKNAAESLQNGSERQFSSLSMLPQSNFCGTLREGRASIT